MNGKQLTPVRIQLQRRKGWRIPQDTIKVDRSTKWGNPFRIEPGYSAAQTIENYQQWLLGNASETRRFAAIHGQPPSIEEIRLELAGKNLACWCAPTLPCHGEILLVLANS